MTGRPSLSLVPPSAARRARKALPREHLEHVEGWGMSTGTMSYVWRPSTVAGILEVFALARAHGLTVGLRGGGQSYGDAALNAENISLDISRLTRILAWDPGTGIVTVEPGVTIRQLWQYAIEDGFWPPVVPGTSFVSLGGAAAMNIHGKNNWKVGPLGDHILAFDLLLPNGDVRRCSREENAELFHAAIGGFGMFGCFTSITLKLKRVYSGLLHVEATTAPDLGAMARVFEERLDRADYLVGWVDNHARGPALGRGVIHEARHFSPGEDPAPAQTLRVGAQELPDTLFGVLPKSLMWRLMKPFTGHAGTRLVNAAKYHSSRLQGTHAFRQSHAAFAFLLDYVPNWKFAYRPGGLIQYQSFVPAAHAVEVFTAALALAQRRGLIPYLGVFKRHRPDAFLMTHAVDGYSLALDFKVRTATRERLWALAGELNRLVLGAGGRFYLAKDSTLTPESARAAFGEDRFARFLALKRACDPEGLLATNLSRRLFG